MGPFYNFQSYPNTYYTKLRGTPQKLPPQHQKMNYLVCNYPKTINFLFNLKMYAKKSFHLSTMYLTTYMNLFTTS